MRDEKKSHAWDNNSSPDRSSMSLLIAIIAMPLLGLYLLSQPSDQDKSVGLVLLIVGIILWIVYFTSGGR